MRLANTAITPTVDAITRFDIAVLAELDLISVTASELSKRSIFRFIRPIASVFVVQGP